MHVDLRPRSVGELIGQTFALSAAHFGRLFLIMAALNAPAVALQMLEHRVAAGQDPVTALALALAALFLVLIVTPLGVAAALELVACSYTGQPCSLGRALAVGLRRFFPLLGTSMAVGLLVSLGTLLLIVPGVIAFVAFFVAPCATVLESRGVGASLRRSRDLTRGHRGRVFAIAVVVMLLAYILPAAVLAAFDLTEADNLGVAVASTALAAACSIPSTIAPVVVFFDLRVRKEAFDVAMLKDLVAQIGRTIEPQPQP